MELMIRQFLLISFSLLLVAISGCSSAPVTPEQQAEFHLKSRLSNPVNVPGPLNFVQKTVYVNIINHSNDPDFDIEQMVENDLKAKGYRIMRTADKAHYLLEANIILVLKNKGPLAQQLFKQGYHPIGENQDNTAIEKNNLEEGNGLFKRYATYAVITDMQISKRTVGAIKANNASVTTKVDSNGNQQKVSDIEAYMNTPHWARYQTRMLSFVQKGNKEYGEAKDLLAKELADALVKLFKPAK